MGLSRGRVCVSAFVVWAIWARSGVAGPQQWWVEVPAGFVGAVLIEEGVPQCPYPVERDGRTTLAVTVVSGEGRSCSRRERGAGKWKVAHAGAARKPLPDAPAEPLHVARLKVNPKRLYVWWEVSGTCEDLGRPTWYFVVGTVSDFERTRPFPARCLPTPWP